MKKCSQENSAFHYVVGYINHCMKAILVIVFLLVSSLAMFAQTTTAPGSPLPRGKEAVLKKLRSIIIKKVEFDHTPIKDAMDYFTSESRAADLPNHEGVNIVLALNSSSTEEKNLPTITADLKNVSLMQALEFSTSSAGLKMKITEGGVIIAHEFKATDGNFQTRSFAVSPEFFRPPGGWNQKTEENQNPKKILENAGISFPDGTGAIYNPQLGRLVVTHTPDILDQIKAIVQNF